MGWTDLENNMLNDAYWDRPKYREWDPYYDWLDEDGEEEEDGEEDS